MDRRETPGHHSHRVDLGESLVPRVLFMIQQPFGHDMELTFWA